jgi:hypothetical protein
MRDTLQAFSDHCNRAGLLKRPTIYVRFTDIWGDATGEIGVPDPEDLHHTTFALLSPWVMVPTLSEAHLVIDRLECLEVTKVKATQRGYFEPSWQVDYQMDDRGNLVFGESVDAPIIPEVGTAITAAKKARMEQRFWQWHYTFEDVVPVVAGLLEQGGIIPE